MGTHTAGPWEFDELTRDVLGANGEPVASPCDGYDEGQWPADARLIAAAPDLLATLKEFLAWGAMTGSDRDLFAGKFRDVIAKAEQP